MYVVCSYSSCCQAEWQYEEWPEVALKHALSFHPYAVLFSKSLVQLCILCYFLFTAVRRAQGVLLCRAASSEVAGDQEGLSWPIVIYLCRATPRPARSKGWVLLAPRSPRGSPEHRGYTGRPIRTLHTTNLPSHHEGGKLGLRPAKTKVGTGTLQLSPEASPFLSPTYLIPVN